MHRALRAVQRDWVVNVRPMQDPPSMLRSPSLPRALARRLATACFERHTRTGYGFNATLSQCVPCDIDSCDKCGPDGRCEECASGFGITPRGACDKCGFFCRSCGASSSCKWCDDTYVLKDGLCFSCGDRCASCTTSGAGKCDVCLPGFIRDNVTWNCNHDDYANLMEELYEEEM
mmetsp:Transcript_45478/g.145958  ORF Transcript_45478/g.145958 Transcript_45478/m.145958 type:complete len:175 (-) Transcript_45478:81-605(-)